MNKILVMSNRPPNTYLNALCTVGLDYECKFVPKDLSVYSGLLLTGGGDILPIIYNGETSAENINIIRDKVELDTLGYFADKKLPVLGICRGAQLINVFFGGKLSVTAGHLSPEGDVFHRVETPCGNTFSQNIDMVNSAHRQHCKPIADKADILLVADDKTVEAFSVGSNILAVQFHPERLNKDAIIAVYGKFANIVNNRQ